MPSLREIRQRVISRAVAKVDLAGTRNRPSRQEWGESRKARGWTKKLVDDAIGAGALAQVRAVSEGREEMPPCVCEPGGYMCRWHRALAALAIIDSGRGVEVVLPKPLERDEAEAPKRRAY